MKKLRRKRDDMKRAAKPSLDKIKALEKEIEEVARLRNHARLLETPKGSLLSPASGKKAGGHQGVDYPVENWVSVATDVSETT